MHRMMMLRRTARRKEVNDATKDEVKENGEEKGGECRKDGSSSRKMRGQRK